MAAIPGTRRFDHFVELVRARRWINVEESKKAHRFVLVADEIFEVEDAFLRLQGIELIDVIGIRFKSLQPLLKVHSRASEVMGSKAVTWIAQQQRDSFVNLSPARVIQTGEIAPFRLSPHIMRAIEQDRTFRNDLRATWRADAREIFRAITQPVQTAALK